MRGAPNLTRRPAAQPALLRAVRAGAGRRSPNAAGRPLFSQACADEDNPRSNAFNLWSLSILDAIVRSLKRSHYPSSFKLHWILEKQIFPGEMSENPVTFERAASAAQT
jgi:hypothetical protein